MCVCSILDIFGTVCPSGLLLHDNSDYLHTIGLIENRSSSGGRYEVIVQMTEAKSLICT
jgi:hypothetical protein